MNFLKFKTFYLIARRKGKEEREERIIKYYHYQVPCSCSLHHTVDINSVSFPSLNKSTIEYQLNIIIYSKGTGKKIKRNSLE